jgi:hypothetical protein
VLHLRERKETEIISLNVTLFVKKLVSLQKKIINVSAIHLQPKRWSLLAEEQINRNCITNLEYTEHGIKGFIFQA